MGQVIPVLMPQAGNSMEEGTVRNWRVKVGDTIAVGQVVCEVETDKATIDLEATDAGRLAVIMAAEGTVVPVKEAIAYLAENMADVEAFLARGNSKGQGAVVEVLPQMVVSRRAAEEPLRVMEQVRLRSSPAARKLARERGIDLAALGAGSGPQGRVLSTDVPERQSVAAGAGNRRPMSKMRRALAANLQMSKQTVPHFYVRATLHAAPLMAFYKEQKAATGCTLNDVVLLALGRVLQEFPAFRSHVDGHDIVEVDGANVGIAVGMEEGLVVPVLLHVEAMTLAQVAAEALRVIEQAREGKVEHVGRAVFSISNMGMLGVEEFSAIINPPESGILAVGAVREGVMARDGVMVATRVMTVTLSVDHRVVDGAMAAAFMERLKTLLEAPELLVRRRHG